MNQKEIKTSIILKISNIIFVIIGLICSYFIGYTHGLPTLLYFTNQSNLWIAVISFILLFPLFKQLKNNENYVKVGYFIAYFVFVVSITLTGFTFCFILCPAALFKPLPPELDPVMLIPAVILHVVVPIISIIDFIKYTRCKPIKYIYSLFATIPPFYYLFFALICYINNVDFGHGTNYPYFFLNYDSPAGLFGFSSEGPYFIGSFYWFIILFILVILTGTLYLIIINKRNLKNNRF